MKFSSQLLLFLFFVAPSSLLFAQNGPPKPKISTYVKNDSKVYRGMFNIYVQDDKYLLEIPDRLLGRDILTSITIISGSAQRRRNPAMRFGFAGDAVNDRVISFTKGSNGKMNLVTPEFVQATDTLGMYFNTLKVMPVPNLLVFDILAAENSSSLIDITALFAGNSELFSLKGAAMELKLGSFQPEKSRILGVSSFENNLVFRSIKSYGEGISAQTEATEAGAEMPAIPQTNPTIWEVGASWFLLPEIPMKQRYADKRIGYFVTELKNYDSNPERNENLSVANRWRMEPKPEDVQQYLRGELVEPAKPIVFYIDRNTPDYLIPYITEGVNAWRKSFEKIGFKNAITGKLAPTAAEDPDFSMEDVRYSYISYKPSEMANAYGPQVVDPRSGEILSSHVGVFHNLLDLLQGWYFSMCANTDPGGRKIPMDKALIGTLLKNVITHEVGHTLGLRHNFAGSSSYAVDSLRNRDFVRRNSFGPSVMDYMRFNYAAQPEDKMSPSDLLPVIGVYDDYAIDWGYRYRPEFKDAQAEATSLKLWVSDKRKDPRFFYQDEKDYDDPRVQSEDIGDNNMKANRLGLQNLKKIMEGLEHWKNAGDEDYHTLGSLYRSVHSRYYIYLQHVIKNIGGSFGDQALRSEQKSNHQPVGQAQQKEAMAYLREFFFTEPKWLYPEGVMAKSKFSFDKDIEGAYRNAFEGLMAKSGNLLQHTGDDEYTVNTFLTDLQQAVFKDMEQDKPVSRYNRMMQRVFLRSVLMQLSSRSNLITGAGLAMDKLLKLTREQAVAAAAKQQDFISKSHFTTIVHLIDVWETGRNDVVLSR